ncbi:MAG: nicotinate (nicotinamide) nucleotide adenylyltransferase [Planctomycetaceae bacterium]|jgi:nicotinate-nucleotide adenylyltransferase|nr:nicotinate (nicotinamide) nucleotide adenylyltransferase [Planctomycetaceae bacterium]
MNMRYGIYGGAFDPVHIGHLLLAESCLCEASLDRVIFVPTGISPHRNLKNSYTASAQDRYNMLAAAINNYNKFEISRFEIDRDTVSYTIDTLRYFHGKFNNVTKNTKQNYCNKNCNTAVETETQVEIFLILGCDMFCDLPNWRESSEILKLATPLVALRNGSQMPNTKINYIPVNMPTIDISSTKIRNMLANNITPRFQTTEKVLNYIKTHNLYSKTQQ